MVGPLRSRSSSLAVRLGAGRGRSRTQSTPAPVRRVARHPRVCEPHEPFQARALRGQAARLLGAPVSIKVELSELPSLCTAEEAARALRTSSRTIKRMVSRGQLRVAKLAIGGSSRVLVPRVELERVVRESML
jgi:excisionase family DNA binding protein